MHGWDGEDDTAIRKEEDEITVCCKMKVTLPVGGTKMRLSCTIGWSKTILQVGKVKMRSPHAGGKRKWISQTGRKTKTISPAGGKTKTRLQ